MDANAYKAFSASLRSSDDQVQHIYVRGTYRGVFIELCDRDVILTVGGRQFAFRTGSFGYFWWGYPLDCSDFTLSIVQKPVISSNPAPQIQGTLINVAPAMGNDNHPPVYEDFAKTDVVQFIPAISLPPRTPIEMAILMGYSQSAGEAIAASIDTAGRLSVAVNAAVQPTRKPTYLASGRMTAMPRALSRVFGGAASQQMTCVYHDASSSKLLKLISAQITFLSISAPVEVNVFLVHLDGVTAPSGNLAGANATLVQLSPDDPAPNAIMVAQPTVAGSNNYSVAFVEVLPGVTGAASTVNPPAIGTPIELVNQNPAAGFPSQGIATAGGYAIQVNVSGACTITCFTQMIFTEE